MHPLATFSFLSLVCRLVGRSVHLLVRLLVHGNAFAFYLLGATNAMYTALFFFFHFFSFSWLLLSRFYLLPPRRSFLLVAPSSFLHFNNTKH